MLSLDVGGSSSCARIGCGYRPPHMPQTYWDIFESNLEGACYGSHAATIPVNDFNNNLLSPNTFSTKLFCNILTRFCLEIYVTSATRVMRQSQSLIDLFLTSCLVQGDYETVYCHIRDHHAVLARVPVCLSLQKAPLARRSRKLHKISWDNLKEVLTASFANPPEQDLNMMVIVFPVKTSLTY